jgi:hypothetical protein
LYKKRGKKVRQTNQDCYVLHHDGFTKVNGTPEDIYAACRMCKLYEEGSVEGFFETITAVEEEEKADEEPQQQLLPEDVRNFQPGDNIQILLNNGIFVDEDNQPEPENLPSNNKTTPTTNNIYKDWGFSGICPRRAAGHTKTDAKLNN